MGVILFHVSTIQGSSSLSSGKSGTPWNLKFILGISARSSLGRLVASYFLKLLAVNFSHTFCRDRPCWGKATHVIDKWINGATRLLSLRLPVLRSQHEVPKFYNGHCLEFSWTALPRYFLLLSRLKKQWAAWSIRIGNPAIATGLLLHEVIVWCIWVSYMSENGSYNLQRHIYRRSSGSTLK